MYLLQIIVGLSYSSACGLVPEGSFKGPQGLGVHSLPPSEHDVQIVEVEQHPTISELSSRLQDFALETLYNAILLASLEFFSGCSSNHQP